MENDHLKRLPRLALAHLPTPIEALPRLSTALGGPRLFVKRDDLTGLAGGGNKTRKLEFLVAEALAQQADLLLTVGAPQSNHCRQTAAAAAHAGLPCALILRGHAPANTTGNLLLDHLLGAEVHWSGDREREDVLDDLTAQARAAGRRPYPIPLGGSNALGAAAYVAAMFELQAQVSTLGLRFDRLVFASSTGGTQAGLTVGARLTNFTGEVLGISVDEEQATLQARVAEIATTTSDLLNAPHAYAPSAITVNADYLGGGYSIMGAPEREAIELFARYEGLLVDPVYTGRAAAGLIDLIRRGVIDRDETILFWHTGGTPALWAYAAELIA